MTRHFFILILAIIFMDSSYLHAQNKLTGKIIDTSYAPVSYANVALLKSDSSFVKGGVSDDNGNISILVPEDIMREKMLLKVTCVGFTEKYIPLNHQLVLGNIVLNAEVHSLHGVVIKAYRTPYQAKGSAIVANVTGTILEKEIHIKDLLRKIPGMMMDKKSLVTINGDPIYYINGRKVQSFAEVEQLAVKSIDRVEVNTNPGAEYDASVGAVINIYLKQKTNGWSAQWNQDYSRNHRNSHDESLNLNYQHGGLNLFGTFGYGDSRERDISHIVTDIATADTMWRQDTRMVSLQSYEKNYTYSLGVDYKLNDKSSFGFKYDGNFMSALDTPYTTTVITAGNQFYTNLVSISNVPNHDHSHHYNGYFKEVFEKRSDLSVYADYVHKTSGRIEGTNETSEKYGDEFTESTNHALYNLYAVSTKYNHAINDSNSYNLGIETGSVDGKSMLVYSGNNLSGSSTKTRENKVAGFFSYSLSLKRFSAKVGFRYEKVNSHYTDLLDADNNICRNYSNLFPSMEVNYNLNSLFQSLSYRSGVVRPDFGKLNSYSFYVNRFLYQEGNPNLTPQIFHSVNYSLRYKFLNVMLGYTYNKNYIGTYLYSSSKDSLAYISSWSNYNKQQKLKATITLQHRFGFYEPSLSASCIKNILKIEAIKHTNGINDPTFIIDSNNAFHLPNDILFNVEYQSRGGSGDLFVFKYTNVFNLMLQKSFCKDALQVNLQVNDLFYKGVPTYWRSMNNLSFYHREDYDPRSFSINIVYRFNHYKNKYKGENAANDDIRRL